MENNNTNPSQPAAPSADDPRYGFAHVVEIVGRLISETDPAHIGNDTPCSEYTVKELLEHMVLVMARVAVIGNGEHWSTVTEVATPGGWADDFHTAAHDVMQAWSDSAKLDQVFEVPWGEFPGAVLMYTYTAELATHGWDLAIATGRTLAIDDQVLQGALFAAKMIPSEGRDTPDVPFSAVVEPGPNATVLEQIAAWGGRNVLG